MGATESRQKLGERVTIAKRDLQQAQETALQQQVLWESSDHGIFKKAFSTLQAAITSRSPIQASLLFQCWYADSKLVTKLILNECETILNPRRLIGMNENKRYINGIKNENPKATQNNHNGNEFLWLKTNILNHLIWCMPCESTSTSKSANSFMFEKLNSIASKYADNIKNELIVIYKELEKETRFKELMAIKDSTLINRQDNKKVGLLKYFVENTNISKNVHTSDEKSENKNDDDMHRRQQFMNIVIGLQELIAVGNELNNEYCDYIGHLFDPLLESYKMVEFRRAPIKSLDRCQAKVEFSYVATAVRVVLFVCWRDLSVICLL